MHQSSDADAEQVHETVADGGHEALAVRAEQVVPVASLEILECGGRALIGPDGTGPMCAAPIDDPPARAQILQREQLVAQCRVHRQPEQRGARQTRSPRQHQW